MKSLRMMIAQLNQLEKNLDNIADELGRRLVNAGWDEAHTILADHIFDGDTIESLTAERGRRSKNTRAFELYMESPAALFVEFGSGLRGVGHPKASELGMGAGTYPGQKHALDPNGWYFFTRDPRLIRIRELGKRGKPLKNGKSFGHSYGNVPVMPMYKAMRKIRQIIPETAGKVVEEHIDKH